MAVDYPEITLHRPLNHIEILHHVENATDDIAQTALSTCGVWFADDGVETLIVPTAAFLAHLQECGIKYKPCYPSNSFSRMTGQPTE